MAEWIMKEEKDTDGVDCYIKTGEVIRCKDCQNLHSDYCPMFFEDNPIWDGKDERYCFYGRRRNDGR